MKTRNDKPEVFWSKVDVKDEDSCWNWMGCVNSTGRGMFSIGLKRNIKSHRWAWILTNGEIPDGLFICHHCDNPKCCNPKHLFLGTIQTNTRDMDNKGRRVTLRGEQDPKSKLTEQEVREIRDIWNNDNRPTQNELAERYGVKRTTIEAIVLRHTWKYLV